MAADIQKLTIKSYPDVRQTVRDQIATDFFVNAISSSTVRQKVREKHPKELTSAIKEARQISADQETESMLMKRSERAHVTMEE